MDGKEASGVGGGAEAMKTVCLDFDGVMNTYDGWKGERELFEPRPGLRDFLEQLKAIPVRVVVHSTRRSGLIVDWLRVHDLDHLIDDVDKKPPAIVYIDDRAMPFRGSFFGLVADIKDFKTHWEMGREREAR